MDALADLPDVEWHLIGPLQSNKTTLAAERFALGADDRPAEDRRAAVARARPPDLPPLDVCVQVNISGEATKSGVAPDDALALAQAVAALPRLRCADSWASPSRPPIVARASARSFACCARCSTAAARPGLPLDTLSMGMSADLEAAIAEGATLVRVGTAIFGPRGRDARRRAPSEPASRRAEPRRTRRDTHERLHRRRQHGDRAHRRAGRARRAADATCTSSSRRRSSARRSLRAFRVSCVVRDRPTRRASPTPARRARGQAAADARRRARGSRRRSRARAPVVLTHRRRHPARRPLALARRLSRASCARCPTRRR